MYAYLAGFNIEEKGHFDLKGVKLRLKYNAFEEKLYWSLEKYASFYQKLGIKTVLHILAQKEHKDFQQEVQYLPLIKDECSFISPQNQLVVLGTFQM